MKENTIAIYLKIKRLSDDLSIQLLGVYTREMRELPTLPRNKSGGTKLGVICSPIKKSSSKEEERCHH